MAAHSCLELWSGKNFHSVEEEMETGQMTCAGLQSVIKVGLAFYTPSNKS